MTRCAALRAAGFLLIVVSNQPDVGNGLISPATLDQMNRLLSERSRSTT